MKYAFYFFSVMFVLSCHQADKSEDPDLRTVVQPVAQPSELELSIRSALNQIITKEIENSGNRVNSLQFTGMEIVRISEKDYFTDEEQSQEADFNSYLKYVERFKNSSNKINDPVEIANNKRKHAAVMAYLKSIVNKEPTDKDLYKVTYYLKTDTRDYKFTQLQTTYLDKDLKKMTMDYSHLRDPKKVLH